MQTGKQPTPINSRGLLIVVVLLVVVFGAIRLVQQDDSSRRPVYISPATPDQFQVFTEVRNNCGACGNNSPVGGWENRNGDAMILNANKTFTIIMADGSSFDGDWTTNRGNLELCLLPNVGDTQCFAYEQKVDAMTLDGAIFIRR